ncbi:MAG: thioredoxin family protein [Polyangiaceae bacterium]|nr:thioredoxin family protein [Polyangiaceae bacterium]
MKLPLRKRFMPAIGFALLAGCSTTSPPPVETGTLEVSLATSATASTQTSSVAIPRKAPAEPATVGVWLTDEPQAVAEAKRAKKPMLVVFCADWAAPCKSMFERTMEDPEVKGQLARFVLLKVDLTNGDDPVAVGVAEKYDAMAIPFLVLVDSKLQKVARLAGVASPKELADALAKVH